MLRPADLLFLDEPTNDLDIPALEVLEDSLEEFPGAVVLVSHDRDLMDRLCTEVIGLDGRGGAARYGSVGQWLAAYEPPVDGSRGARQGGTPGTACGSRAAEAEEAELQASSRSGTGWRRRSWPRRWRWRRGRPRWSGPRPPGTRRWPRPAGDWRSAQQAVERLYARWQELEAKRA